MSLMRGTTSLSVFRIARRSALETTFSMAEIGSRWLTPDRLSIFLSSRAAKATRSMTCCTYAGSCIVFPLRRVQASCAVMAIPSSIVAG